MLTLQEHLAHTRGRTSDRTADFGVIDSRRRHERFPYLHEAVLVQVLSGTSRGQSQLMSTRDISAGGASLLSDRPLDRGTRLAFIRRDGSGSQVPGRIVRCQPADGGMFVLGVRFDSLVNPLTYVDPTF